MMSDCPSLAEASRDQLAQELARRGELTLVLQVQNTQGKREEVFVYWRGSHLGVVGLARYAEERLLDDIRPMSREDDE